MRGAKKLKSSWQSSGVWRHITYHQRIQPAEGPLNNNPLHSVTMCKPVERTIASSRLNPFAWYRHCFFTLGCYLTIPGRHLKDRGLGSKHPAGSLSMASESLCIPHPWMKTGFSKFVKIAAQNSPSPLGRSFPLSESNIDSTETYPVWKQYLSASGPKPERTGRKNVWESRHRISPSRPSHLWC